MNQNTTDYKTPISTLIIALQPLKTKPQTTYRRNSSFQRHIERFNQEIE